LLPKRFDTPKPELRIVVLEVAVQEFLSRLVDNAGVHRLAVKIDAAVELVLLGVEIHHGLFGLRVLEPRTIRGSDVVKRAVLFLDKSNHSSEAMMSIKPLQPTSGPMSPAQWQWRPYFVALIVVEPEGLELRKR
jgi:hypothetical protein